MNSDSSPKGSRILDIGEEIGQNGAAFAELFPVDLPIPSFADAIEGITGILPEIKEHVDLALDRAKHIQRKYNWMSLEEIAAIVLFMMETKPREASLHFALNRVLRERCQSSAKPWKYFIIFFLHALKQVPASPIVQLVCGSTARIGDMGLDLEPGDCFTWSGFSSVTLSVDHVKMLLGDKEDRTVVHLQMLKKIGREVTDFSFFSDQTEILLPPNVSFEFVSKVVSENGLTIVQAKQRESPDIPLDLSMEEDDTAAGSGAIAVLKLARSSKLLSGVNKEHHIEKMVSPARMNGDQVECIKGALVKDIFENEGITEALVADGDSKTANNESVERGEKQRQIVDKETGAPEPREESSEELGIINRSGNGATECKGLAEPIKIIDNDSRARTSANPREEEQTLADDALSKDSISETVAANGDSNGTSVGSQRTITAHAELEDIESVVPRSEDESAVKRLSEGADAGYTIDTEANEIEDRKHVESKRAEEDTSGRSVSIDACSTNVAVADADIWEETYSDDGRELYSAIYSRRELSVIEGLIDRRADIHWSNDAGDTSLYLASQEGIDAILKTLLKARADINQPREDGGTPLTTASEKGHVSIVQALMSARADVNHQMENGTASLAAACIYNHKDVVVTLLDAKATAIGHAITTATHYGFVDLIAILEEAMPLQIKSLERGWELYNLIYYENEDSLSEISRLIDGRADIDWSNDAGDTPCYLASQEGQDAVVATLIGAKVDVNKARLDGGTPLTIAAERGHRSIVQTLISTRANVNHEMQNGTASLAAACINGHKDVVRMLLLAKALPNSHALITAEFYSHHSTVDILMAAGAGR